MAKWTMLKAKWWGMFCILFCLLGLLYAALLAGCDLTPVGLGGGETPPTSTLNLDGSPKGPGSANLTATALAPSATPPACAILSVAPASTAGWHTYKDSQYHFQFAYPPGWQPVLSTGDSSDHTIAIFPPGSAIPPLGIAAGATEYFQVSLLLSGTPSDPAHDSNWRPTGTTLTINGQQTPLYYRPAVECQTENRLAVADFGQHHFSYYMTTKPAQATRDISLFPGIVQSFVYNG